MSAPAVTKPKPDATLAPVEPTVSENFVAKVQKQFAAEMGGPIHWTQLQKALAQHMYVKLNAALEEAQSRRASNNFKKNDPPITWANVDMIKLATRAVNVVSLELDAYQKNHLFFIPYLNKRTGKYDIDIRIGYMGEDHCRRKFAIDEIVDITYQLVFDGDHFDIVRNQHGVEVPEYRPKSYFDAPTDGIIGGFGYIQYADPRKNKVIPVAKREFEKAQKASMGVEFWGGEQTKWENGKKVNAGHDDKFYNEMCFKTVVHRVTAKIPLDSSKVNLSAFDEMLEGQIHAIDAEFKEEHDANANTEALALGSGEEATVQIPQSKAPEPTAATIAPQATEGQSTLTEEAPY